MSPSEKGESNGRSVHRWLERHGLLSPGGDDYLNDDFWEEIRQSSRENMTWEETIHVMAFIASSRIPQDPWWDYFAASVLMADHKDRTTESFCEVVRILQDNRDATGSARPLLDEGFAGWILENEDWIEKVFRDEVSVPHFRISLFGWKTLYRSYLMRANSRVVERPDHLWFRVALFLHRGHRERKVQCFRDLRDGSYTHATPTLFYAGARRPQMASCFPWNAVVFTPHGGRPIGSLQKGDTVLTHHGKWKKVLQVHTDVVGQDRGFKRVHWKSSLSSGVFEVTSDHSFLVNTNEWKKIEDIRPGKDRFVHVHDIVPVPGQEASSRTDDAWIDTIGRHLVAFRSLYEDHGGATMGEMPDAIKRAVKGWEEASDRGRYLEYFLVEHAVSWIPIILQRLCEVHRVSGGVRRIRESWSEQGDAYIRMWYEQWMVFTELGRVEDGCVRVEDLPPLEMDEVVYTLGVEDDHSYVVQGLIAQNCFLVGTEDSLEGIFKTISDVAQISKWAGGVGVHISNIRSNRSYIYGTNGYSNGILPMIRLYNDTSRYIDQCLEADTRVWIRGSGWKRIADIQPGDCVLTQRGRYEAVRQVVSHAMHAPAESATMFRVWLSEKRHVDITGEHDVLMHVEGSSEHAPDWYEGTSEDGAPPGSGPGARAIYCPISAWSPESRGVLMVPPREPQPRPQNVQGWDIAWVRALRILLELSPVVSDPSVWCVRRLPDDFPVHPLCEIDRTGADGMIRVGWGARVVFPWTWRPVVLSGSACGFTPGIPYEWLSFDEKTIHEAWWEEIEKMGRCATGAWVLFVDSMRYHRSMRSVADSTIVRKWKKVESVPWDPTRHRVLYDLVVEGHPSYMTEIGVVHNGGGKRNGAFAMYMEPWHADILAFLHAKKNTGPEEERARDLFYGMWIPDLFMKRVVSNAMWSLMCPKECPGLVESHSDAFERLYEEYEEKQMYKRQMPARELFSEMIRCQIETGTPYFLYKDTCNRRSNQKHLGTIRSSNLCVTGNTLILTRDGYRSIDRCVGSVVEIWNGKEFQKVVPLQTSERTTTGLVEIRTTNGKLLRCTPDHVFFLDNEKKVKASMLAKGDRLISHVLPGVGCFSKKWADDIQRATAYILSNGIRIGDNHYVRSEDMPSLQELHLDMELLGIHSCIVEKSSSSSSLSMNILQITGAEAWDALGHSLRTHRLPVLTGEERMRVADTIETVTVQPTVSVPVYCFREPFRHRAVFQGILAGQCTEIIEYSDANEYAVCNLASLSLPACCERNPRRETVASISVHPDDRHEYEMRWVVNRVNEGSSSSTDRIVILEDASIQRGYCRVVVGNGPDPSERVLSPRAIWKEYLAPVFDFEKLGRLTRALVVNLNAVIDQNRYPTPETRFSNLRHRPIGIGVQGFADVFCKMKIGFDSEEARQLNQDIFETIYFSALGASCEMAMEAGAYATFQGSPLSQGQLHWEMTEARPSMRMRFGVQEWEALRQKIVMHGVRNSLMIAPMPTASTSQILNNNECFEPYTSNFYTRRTSVGEFLIYNKELFLDLKAMGMWTTEMRQKLLWTRGSLKDTEEIPEWLRGVYRTVWEIPQKSIIDMASDRQFFIDQSQSMNLFMAEPNLETLTKMHLYGWKKGLKTGSYYIRSRPPMATPHFALDPNFTSSSVVVEKTGGAGTRTLSAPPPAAGEERTVAVACPYKKRGEEEDDGTCMACSA